MPVVKETATRHNLMFLLALRTLPIMFSFSVFGNYPGVKKRIFISKYLPVFSFLVAVLLLLRGLNLGIPYVSPHFEADASTMENCH